MDLKEAFNKVCKDKEDKLYKLARKCAKRRDMDKSKMYLDKIFKKDYNIKVKNIFELIKGD